jgi:hypothetical protein
MQRRVRATVVSAIVLLLAGCSLAPASGTSDAAPPWPAPTDRAERADAAGLRNVWGERLAEHVHTHVSITADGVAIMIPGGIGHDARARFAAQLHTHDDSGIVHVESPTRRTFTLGEFLDEWGVALTPYRVGGLRGDLTTWVDGRRFIGNPRSIPLRDLEQVDLVVTSAGQVPRRPHAFVWPPQYR